MAKKKNFRPKGPVQILASIGLVIAILWTAKGLFQAGTSGYKEVTKKVSSSSGLPVLKCVANDKTHTDIIDLQLMKNNQPANLKEISKKRNTSYEVVTVDAKEYFINYVRHENGYRQGYILKIDRNTGVGEYVFPDKLPVGSSVGDSIAAYQNAKRYFAVCERVKRKKL